MSHLARTPLARRLIIVVVVLILAALAAWQSISNVFARSTPAYIFAVDPSHPRALPAVVDQLSATTNPPGPPSPENVALLRESLTRQPLSSRALRQLAMAEDAAGREESARALLVAASKVSRRDAAAEVLLAQVTARRNDLEGTIAHLDAALSTSRRADSVVFPLLSKLVSNPDFRAATGKYLGRGWGEPFLLYAAQNAPPQDVLQLALKAPMVQQAPRFARFRSELVSHLASGGFPDRAIDYAARISGRPAALAEHGFFPATLAPELAPVSWRLRNADGIYVSPAEAGVVVSADPAARGRALERIFALRPGPHRLQIAADPVLNSEKLAGSWRLACIGGGGADSTLVEVTPQIATNGVIAVPFTVPLGCRAVQLTLDVVNADEQNPAEIRFARLALSPQGG